MKHAKQMILKDVEDTDFMLPFTVGLMIYGDLCGQTKYGETLSKLKSEYGKQRLKNDKKQLALIEIEGELNNSTYPFDKRGHRAKFCKEMLAKYTEIQDIKTIERLFDRLKKAKNTHLAS